MWRATYAVLTLSLIVGYATSGEAITACKAKMNARDGVVLVDAVGVSGGLLWGHEPGKEVFPLFDNAGSCVTPGAPKRCELGAAGTRERTYPPEGCVVHLKDTGDASTCAAYLKRCIPGRRPCPSDMVAVGGVCIDKYEASVWDSPTGTTQYGVAADDYPCGDNGQDCTNNIYARSVAGVMPSAYLTWFQAQQACANVGKRLLANAEWQMAAVGTPDPGLDNGSTDCNTAIGGTTVPTGSRSDCRSAVGGFDMVGNLAEWVAEWVPASTECPGWGSFSEDLMCLSGVSTMASGPGALVRGGNQSMGAGAGPLTVSGTVAPSVSNYIFGFRCAR